jgi:hypothetical protein
MDKVQKYNSFKINHGLTKCNQSHDIKGRGLTCSGCRVQHMNRGNLNKVRNKGGGGVV